MRLASNSVIPPKEWEHSPILFNNDDFTVAMYLANKKIVPPI